MLLDVPDERLRLVFTCCHPALAEEARVGLTLRTLCGLSTADVARAFLVPEATMAKRLLGHAIERPALEGDLHRLLEGVLRQVEVAEAGDQRRQDDPRLLAEDALQVSHSREDTGERPRRPHLDRADPRARDPLCPGECLVQIPALEQEEAR